MNFFCKQPPILHRGFQTDREKTLRIFGALMCALIFPPSVALFQGRCRFSDSRVWSALVIMNASIAAAGCM